MIAAVLAWTKWPTWIQELIFVVVIAICVAGGMWYYGHEHYEAGIAAQVAKDKAAYDALQAITDKKTAELQARASTAEKAYDDERTASANFVTRNPLEPVRLCLSTAPSGSHLPAIAPLVGGAKNPGAPTAGVQPVPTGDSSDRSGRSGVDISGMLSALANAADDVSARLREFQNR